LYNRAGLEAKKRVLPEKRTKRSIRAEGVSMIATEKK